MRSRSGFTGAALLIVSFWTAAEAADMTWDGGAGDGLWISATNWSGNIVPGASDRAIPTTNGFSTAVKRIFLTTNQTVNELRFVNDTDYVIVEGTNALTIKSGAISGAGYPSKSYATLACPIILGNSGSWVTADNWGSTAFVYGDVTDEGKGYTVTFGNSQNMNYVLGGAWDIGGILSIQNYSTRIGGVFTNADEIVRYGGSVTNAAGIYLDCRLGSTDQSESSLTIENLHQANSDRIRGATRLGTRRNGGNLIFNGHPSDPVAERVSTLDLQSGRMGTLRVEARTAGVQTDLIFDSVQRASGTSVGVDPKTGGRLIVEGSVNTNGLWQPWCFYSTWYTKVGASNDILATVAGDYTALAATGNDAAKIHRFSDASLSLGEAVSVWGLRWDRTSAQVLDLGAYDLTIGSGAMIVAGNLNKTITSAGGQLVFAGEDVIYLVEGNGAFTNFAPVAWSKPPDSPLTYPSLIFARGNRTDGISLAGEDRIGHYSNLFCYAYYSSARRTLTFDGPSDRTFHGSINGVFDLAKRGLGTLTLAGAHERRSGSFNVYEGRLVLAHQTPPTLTVHSGATAEVAAGVTLPANITHTFMESGTLRGLGTTANVALRAGARVAPGNAETVGTLTTSTHLYLSTNVVLAIRINGVTNDVLKVAGNLTLPPAGEPLVIDMRDVSGGAAYVKGKAYTVATWTGTDPSAEPAWVITSGKPGLLDVSGAAATLDKTGNKIVVSGLRSAIHGTILSIL